MVPAITARDEMIATAPGDPTADRHVPVEIVRSAVMSVAVVSAAVVTHVQEEPAVASARAGPVVDPGSPIGATGPAASQEHPPAGPGALAGTQRGATTAGVTTVRETTGVVRTVPGIGAGPDISRAAGTTEDPRDPRAPARAVAVRAADGPTRTAARSRAGTRRREATGTAAAVAIGPAPTEPVARIGEGGPRTGPGVVADGPSVGLRGSGRPTPRAAGTARTALRVARRGAATAMSAGVVTEAVTAGTSGRPVTTAVATRVGPEGTTAGIAVATAEPAEIAAGTTAVGTAGMRVGSVVTTEETAVATAAIPVRAAADTEAATVAAVISAGMPARTAALMPAAPVTAAVPGTTAADTAVTAVAIAETPVVTGVVIAAGMPLVVTVEVLARTTVVTGVATAGMPGATVVDIAWMTGAAVGTAHPTPAAGAPTVRTTGMRSARPTGGMTARRLGSTTARTLVGVTAPRAGRTTSRMPLGRSTARRTAATSAAHGPTSR